MANETSKAMRRRWVEHEQGIFPWRDIFKGRGLDVGAGPDPLPFEDCIALDKKDCDANNLLDFFNSDASFDYIHGSQVLEHLHDPATAIRDWLTLLKPGGHLIITVPDWVLYEGCIWPSRFNPDHKSTWSMFYFGSPAPIHFYIPDFLFQLELESGYAMNRISRLVSTNYDYKIGTSRDQTWVESDGVEAFCEFVLVKR